MRVDWATTLRSSVFVVLAALSCHDQLAAEQHHLHLIENTVPANGVELFYREGGSGPPLLLLHGFTGVGHDWDRYLDEFGRHYTLTVPDLRGHGRSSNPSGEFSYRDSARDMFALLDRLAVRRFKGIGYGAGGCTLLRMAALQPNRIEAMVLVAGGHHLTLEAREVARAIPRLENLPDEWKAYNQRFHPGGDAQVRLLLSQLRAFADSQEDYDFSPRDLSAIPARTLLVWGDRDEWHPIETVVEMYKALPDAELWVVPGEGHEAIWADRGGSQLAADIFAEVALQFLTRDVAE